MIKQIWEAYKLDSDKDPVLEQALEQVIKMTGLEADEIVNVIDKLVNSGEKLAFADIPLVKSANKMPSVNELLNMKPSDAADFVARIMTTGDSKQKNSLVRLMAEMGEKEGEGNLRATQLAKILKDRHLWAPFERFFEKLVTSVRGGGEDPAGKIGSALTSADLFFYLQEFKKSKLNNLPWFSKYTLLWKFIRVIGTRLLKYGAIVGLISAGGYGVYKAYDYFKKTKEKDGYDASITEISAIDTKKPVADIVNQKLNKLYGDE